MTINIKYLTKTTQNSSKSKQQYTHMSYSINNK